MVALTVCGVTALLAHGTVALAGILLLPALTARWVEQTPARPMTRAMFLFGLAASVRAAASLWAAGGGREAGCDIALDPMAVARSWGAQGLAWIVAESLPVLLIAQAEIVSRSRLVRLRAARSTLEQEWSFPPST
jgi:hypothetical protein